MQRLNELNYQAHWEARADSPIIILGKCPYAPIIDQYPELCVMDKHLLETLLDVNVDQIMKIDRQPEGPQHCLFAIESFLGGS
jgi:predicted ArsR family transcriptional regulator